jgi:hypothetical protein
VDQEPRCTSKNRGRASPDGYLSSRLLAKRVGNGSPIRKWSFPRSPPKARGTAVWQGGLGQSCGEAEWLESNTWAKARPRRDRCRGGGGGLTSSMASTL